MDTAPAPPEVVRGRRKDIEQLVGRAGRRIGGERLGKSDRVGLRHREPRIDHAERREQPLLEKVAKPHAGRLLDHPPQHVDRKTVFPDRAGLMDQRRFRQADHLLGGRDVAGLVHQAIRLVDAGRGVRLLDRRIAGDLPVAQPGGMAQQILDGHLTFGRNQRVGNFAVSVGLRDANLEFRKVGQELRYRIGQLEPAFLHEDHGRDRDQGLGHRVDAENRILRHGRIGGLVAEAEALEVGDLALAGDQHDRAGQPTLIDLLLEHLSDPLQALR